MERRELLTEKCASTACIVITPFFPLNMGKSRQQGVFGARRLLFIFWATWENLGASKDKKRRFLGLSMARNGLMGGAPIERIVDGDELVLGCF